MHIHTGEEIPCSDVGFPKGDSPEEGENTDELKQMGIHAAIEKNKAESCYEPLALKTIQDRYVQTVRAIINNAVGLHRLRNPFESYRVRWPDNAKPSVKREALDYEKVDKVFRLGVDSGYLDDAMSGPLCLLSSRRIGILPLSEAAISTANTESISFA